MNVSEFGGKMMDKSVLEKRIHDKAEERADKYFSGFNNFFREHSELVNALESFTEMGITNFINMILKKLLICWLIF